MTKLEIVRQTVEQLGDVSAEDLATFIELRHGIRIDPKFIPVVRASLRELAMLAKFRDESKKLIPTTGTPAGKAA